MTRIVLLFMQLYEMSDDVKRKEFLDELFTFMQKRGELIVSRYRKFDKIFSENCTYLRHNSNLNLT